MLILQAFDNAADQVKAALPRGLVFAEYNGGIPLILIHQQGNVNYMQYYQLTG